MPALYSKLCRHKPTDPSGRSGKARNKTKFQKSVYIGVRATLKFGKFKVAGVDVMYRIFFKNLQKLRLIMLVKIWLFKTIPSAVFEL